MLKVVELIVKYIITIMKMVVTTTTTTTNKNKSYINNDKIIEKFVKWLMATDMTIIRDIKADAIL